MQFDRHTDDKSGSKHVCSKQDSPFDKQLPAKQEALRAILNNSKGTATETQNNRLLSALKEFSLTTFECSRYLDLYHPPARVRDLRKLGHSIITHWVIGITESGRKHRIGLYVLMKEAQQ